jgi:hypothetical protein
LARSLVLFALLLCSACKRSEPVDPPPVAQPPAPRPLTYWGVVAPILETHCTSCHAEGGIGPITLTSFADAKTHAGDIVYQTQSRHMPPWLPNTSACAELRHSRALDEAEIATLKQWADAGAPEGDQADYRAPNIQKTYAELPAKPDAVVVPDLAYSPKRTQGKNDDYHCFVLDPKLTQKERVIGLRIAPGMPSVVHHVLLFEVRPSAIAKIEALDEADPGPGYTCFGGIGVQPTVRASNLAKGELIDFDAQMIVGWAPGAGATDIAGAPTKLPDGTAIQLAAGSRLVMQVHYSLENLDRSKERADQTRVDMWFAKPDDSLKQAVWVPVLKWDFRIPKDASPSDPAATAHAEVNLPIPLDVRGVAPHMHLRGQSIRIESVDHAQSQCLLDVPRWDFHHQEGYWLKDAIPVSRAALTCHWDNRPNAQPIVNGKRKPSHPLHWGEGTDDEMCLAFLYATL